MTQFELLDSDEVPANGAAATRRSRPAKDAGARCGSDSGKAKGTKNGKSELGFEAKLWLAADALRGSMDASEHKHIVLGLIFLKYILDAFEERQGVLLAEAADPGSPLCVAEENFRCDFLEDCDDFAAENVF